MCDMFKSRKNNIWRERIYDLSHASSHCTMTATAVVSPVCRHEFEWMSAPAVCPFSLLMQLEPLSSHPEYYSSPVGVLWSPLDCVLMPLYRLYMPQSSGLHQTPLDCVLCLSIDFTCPSLVESSGV